MGQHGEWGTVPGLLVWLKVPKETFGGLSQQNCIRAQMSMCHTEWAEGPSLPTVHHGPQGSL